MSRPRRFTRARRATAGAVLLLFLALPFANGLGMRAVLGTLASLRVGPLDVTEPAAALSAALAGGRTAALGRLALGAAPAVVVALALGPVFCAWLCPFGLLSETLDRVLPRRRRFHPRAARRAGRARVASLTAVLVLSWAVAVPLGALLQGPRAVTSAAQEGVYLGAPSWFAVAILGGLLALDAVLPRRLFCRALCPAGALAKLLRTRRTLRVAADLARCACTATPACVSSCPWGEDPRRLVALDGCTRCGACVDACRSRALVFTFRPPPRRPARPSGGVAGWLTSARAARRGA